MTRAAGRAARRIGAALLACAVTTAVVVVQGSPADAAIVATVPLGTAGSFAVLASSTVTNTGSSVINGSVGLSPNGFASITGLAPLNPAGPGTVVSPGTIQAADGNTLAARNELDLAITNAKTRPVTATTAADLVNLTLYGGVYAAPADGGGAHGALLLSGDLVLDGNGDLSTVFIILTDSTITTSSNSKVLLINGAQECNVFWQVGSSATLGTNSTFRGTILAQTSITVTTGVTVYGRALAHDAAVTLDTDRFVAPTCEQPAAVTTTTAAPIVVPTTTPTPTTTSTTSTTRPSRPTTTTTPPVAITTSTTTPVAITTSTTTPVGSADAKPPVPNTTSTVVGSGQSVTSTSTPGTDVPGVVTSVPQLPRTGWSTMPLLILALLALLLGTVAVRVERSMLLSRSGAVRARARTRS